MPRLQKIIANISNKKIYDGVSGSELSTNSYPYTSARELSDVELQYVTDYFDQNDFTAYEGFAGQSISSSAVIDNDWNHVDKGSLAVALTAGAVTSIEITQSSLDNIPQITGTIQLINAGSQTETVAYTSVSLVGSNYVFVVDVTLAYSYNAGSQASTNDPPLVKSTDVDISEKDTGLFTVSIDTNTQPYLLAVEGKSSISSCAFEHQIRDSEGNKIFEFEFTFICNNSRDDDGALPPPVGFNFYTKLEVDALLAGKIDKVPTATVGSVAIFTSDGGLEDGGTAGIGDMQKSVYDPNSVEADCFDANNIRFSSIESVSDIINLKSDKNNVLELDNVDVYDPTLDYHPATKKYVDDNSGGGTSDDLGLDTGVTFGLVVSINADTSKVDISAGEIFIRDYMTDPENPVYKKCTYAGETAITLTYLASETYTQFVAIEDPANSGLVKIEQLGGEQGDVQYYKDKVRLQSAIHVDNTTITAITDTKQLSYNKVNDLVNYTVANGSIIEGVTISDNGIGDLSCTRTEGTAVAIDINSANDTRNSSYKSFSEEQALFLYNYRSSSTEFSYETNTSTVLKPSLYNDLTTNTVEAVPADKFTIQRFYFFPISGTIGVAYGQKLYDFQEEAVADLQDGFLVAPTFKDAVLVTAGICKSGATDTTNQAEILFAQSKRNYFDTGLNTVSIRPGYLDVTASTMSFDKTTRTLTETAVGDSFKVRTTSGVVKEITEDSVVISDTEGLFMVYRDDDGVLTSTSNPSRQNIYNLGLSNIVVGFGEWGDSSFQDINILTDLRKTATGMSPSTTMKNLFDYQIYAQSGVAVTDQTISPSGDLDTDVQFGLSNGNLLVADREFDFPAYTRGDTIRVLYIDGTNTRHIDSTNGFAFLQGTDFGLGSEYPVYNNDGTPAVLTPTNNNPDYVWSFIAIVNENEPTRRVVSWMGNSGYSSVNDADNGLDNEIARIESLTGITQEMRVVYAVLIEADTAYTNTPKSIIYKITTIARDNVITGTSGSFPSGLADGSIADNYHTHEYQALKTSTSSVSDVINTVYRANGTGGAKKTVLSISDATTNAVVDTDALVSGDVCNTFAGSTDGTVTVLDAPAHNTTYRIYVSGTAQLRIENVSGDAIWPTITNIDGEFSFKYSSVSGEYK